MERGGEERGENAYLALIYFFTPRSFISPSSTRSNLPMLAVLVRVIDSVRSISPFRAPVPTPALASFARFCVCCRSFFAMRSSASHDPPSPNHSPRLLCRISKHALKNAHRRTHVPGLTGTSCSRCVSSLLFLPFRLHRRKHDCRSSSHISYRAAGTGYP